MALHKLVPQLLAETPLVVSVEIMGVAVMIEFPFIKIGKYKGREFCFGLAPKHPIKFIFPGKLSLTRWWLFWYRQERDNHYYDTMTAEEVKELFGTVPNQTVIDIFTIQRKMEAAIDRH